jgi:hypothetical protein
MGARTPVFSGHLQIVKQAALELRSIINEPKNTDILTSRIGSRGFTLKGFRLTSPSYNTGQWWHDGTVANCHHQIFTASLSILPPGPTEWAIDLSNVAKKLTLLYS